MLSHETALSHRYDVKSVPPRQVEALVVDALRLADVAELRRVLDGARGSREGNPSDRRDPITAKAKGAAADGDHVLVEADTDGLSRRTRGVEDEDMPELLAALSRSVEEEVRGTNGLFGLETGLLERLKGGVRLTPFLRHGSLRRRDPDAAAPGGLAAGGLKKWWRCPRCNLSQVSRTPEETRGRDSKQSVLVLLAACGRRKEVLRVGKPFSRFRGGTTGKFNLARMMA